MFVWSSDMTALVNLTTKDIKLVNIKGVIAVVAVDNNGQYVLHLGEKCGEYMVALSSHVQPIHLGAETAK